MAFEIRDNSGSLFKNEKRTTEKHPNGTGSCVIDGVHYFVSSWTKESKDGAKYQQLAFTKKDKQPQSASRDEVDSDIPF